jgi:hypothetical protein
MAPKTRLITKIATQGSPEYDWWMKQYTLKYSLNRISWRFYEVNGKTKVKLFIY